MLFDQERSGHEARKKAADTAADELRQEAAKRQRLEDTNKVGHITIDAATLQVLFTTPGVTVGLV